MSCSVLAADVNYCRSVACTAVLDRCVLYSILGTSAAIDTSLSKYMYTRICVPRP